MLARRRNGHVARRGWRVEEAGFASIGLNAEMQSPAALANGRSQVMVGRQNKRTGVRKLCRGAKTSERGS